MFGPLMLPSSGKYKRKYIYNYERVRITPTIENNHTISV